MSALPEGWVQSHLGEVCDYIQRGKSPKYTNHSSLPIVNQKCVRWWGIDTEFLKYIDPIQWDKWTEERFLRVGDVLWNSTGTGTIGRAALFNGLSGIDKIVVDSHVTIVRPSRYIEPRYIHSLISSPVVQGRIEKMQAGSTNQVELNKSEVQNTKVPLPPLAEQKRIVERLDRLSARTRAAKDHLAKVQTLATRAKQATLAAAFRGEWGTRQLSDLARVGTGATPKKGNPRFYYNGNIPWVTSSAANQDLVREAEQYITEDAIDETNCKVYPKGTLLVAMYGEGKTRGMVTKLGIDAATNQALAAIQITELTKLHPEWVPWLLQSKYLEMREMAAGGVQPNLNLGIIKAIKVPLPSLKEQTEIVRRIEASFARVDKMVAEATRAADLLERLEQQLLAKAFRGELVAQDPNDEPASVLLERIRQARAADKKTKPKRRRKAPA